MYIMYSLTCIVHLPFGFGMSAYMYMRRSWVHLHLCTHLLAHVIVLYCLCTINSQMVNAHPSLILLFGRTQCTCAGPGSCCVLGKSIAHRTVPRNHTPIQLFGDGRGSFLWGEVLVLGQS